MCPTNQGDEPEVLYNENGPLAQLIVDPPYSFRLITDTGEDQPGTQIEVGPRDVFEIGRKSWYP